MSKNLIYIEDFFKEEIYEIFKRADQFVNDAGQAKSLEGKTILFPPSALDKKEKLEDVIGYLENWVDAIVVRHSDIEVVKNMAKCAKIPVINAMTSDHHPCEIITDLYALSKIYDDIEKKKFLFVRAKGNIGNSWKAASELLGFELEQCCPVGYELKILRFIQISRMQFQAKTLYVQTLYPTMGRKILRSIRLLSNIWKEQIRGQF